MIGKVFIDSPDMEPSPFPLYIVFRGGGETRSINYILNDKTFDEDAKKHFADFFKLWYNSDLKEKLKLTAASHLIRRSTVIDPNDITTG